MIVLETLGRRWFAFAFVAMLWWAAWPEGGWRRALRFWAIAAAGSFLSEFVSTRTGFPYGEYTYVAGTEGQELYLANIPLFVVLSFGTVVFAGRALALGTRFARSSLGLAVTGGALAAVIDLVIDPMTLRSETWFMGELYHFGAGGPWFEVPWTNLGGWFLVSAVIILVDDLIGREARAPSRAAWVRGTTLAFTICGFFIVLALATNHYAIAAGGTGVTAALAAFAFLMPRSFASGQDEVQYQR